MKFFFDLHCSKALVLHFDRHFAESSKRRIECFRRSIKFKGFLCSNNGKPLYFVLIQLVVTSLFSRSRVFNVMIINESIKSGLEAR